MMKQSMRLRDDGHVVIQGEIEGISVSAEWDAKGQFVTHSYTSDGTFDFSKLPQPEQRTPGVGDVLHQLIIERHDVTPEGCDACREWIRRMNGWGPTGCIEHMDEIVSRLVDAFAARFAIRGWAIKRMPFLEPIAREKARDLVLDAIQIAVDREREGERSNTV